MFLLELLLVQRYFNQLFQPNVLKGRTVSLE